jgi:hypothetical protein
MSQSLPSRAVRKKRWTKKYFVFVQTMSKLALYRRIQRLIYIIVELAQWNSVRPQTLIVALLALWNSMVRCHVHKSPPLVPVITSLCISLCFISTNNSQRTFHCRVGDENIGLRRDDVCMGVAVYLINGHPAVHFCSSTGLQQKSSDKHERRAPYCNVRAMDNRRVKMARVLPPAGESKEGSTRKILADGRGGMTPLRKSCPC